jgi:succinoglycan biosynthesis protein ExoA
MSSRDPTPKECVCVSVLVPVLDEELHLEQAARAMLTQELDGEIEFLFIDGGSEDASISTLQELAKEDGRVHVLHNPARRTPHALNIGLRAARGEFVARMDAHTIYPPRYLAGGIERLRRGDVDWVSGPQLATGVSPGSRRVARALTTRLGSGGATFRQDLQGEVEVDTGFTGVWRRQTLERHCGWDEGWVNDQDLELAARIRGAGGRIVCIPEMAADYVPRETLAALARQYLTYGTYRVKTARRHPETLRRSQLAPPALTLTTAAALLSPGNGLRTAARLGVGCYAAMLGLASVRAAAEGGVVESMTLPGVWATMHLSYGLGFLRGCLRYGVPVASAGAVIGWQKDRRAATGGDGERP